MAEMIVVALSEDQWAQVVSGLVRATQIELPEDERAGYRKVGIEIAEQCPKGSAPWFGSALFVGP